MTDHEENVLKENNEENHNVDVKTEKSSSLIKKGGTASVTAEVVALIRATEAEKPADERICYDPYAVKFIRPELLAYYQSLPREKLLEERAKHEKLFPGQQNSILTRVRFFDDTVEDEIASGMPQVVILGAGYDTRAYRIEGIDRARVFEVDREETQAKKKSRILQLFGGLPSHVSYIPLDLVTGDLISSLAEAGFNRTRRALFIMEGLLYYLPPPVVHELLVSIRRETAPGSVILFDYHPQSMVDGTHPSEIAQNLYNYAKKAGEPLLFGIPDEGAAEFLGELGYRNIRDMTDDEYLKKLFSGEKAGRKTTGLLGFCCAEVP